MVRRFAILLLMIGGTACTPQVVSVPTPVAIVKLLATVVLSPTPDNDQRMATLAAASPTAASATITPIPSPTAYVGVFIGEAQDAASFQSFTVPLYAPDFTNTQPTQDASRCGRPIDGRFVGIWQTNSNVSQGLGCPIQQAFGFFGRLQLFEQGVMYLQPDIRAVWAVVPQGNIGRYFYVEAPTALTAPLEPALNGVMPVGDFGSVYSTVEGLAQRLGVGIAAESDAAFALQRFDGGTFLLDASSGQAFALLVDGSAYGPFAVEGIPDLVVTPTTVDAP